jgi:hypothetical protein
MNVTTFHIILSVLECSTLLVHCKWWIFKRSIGWSEIQWAKFVIAHNEKTLTLCCLQWKNWWCQTDVGKTCHVVNHNFTPKSKHERMQVWSALKQGKTNVKWNGKKSQAILKMLLKREASCSCSLFHIGFWSL